MPNTVLEEPIVVKNFSAPEVQERPVDEVIVFQNRDSFKQIQTKEDILELADKAYKYDELVWKHKHEKSVMEVFRKFLEPILYEIQECKTLPKKLKGQVGKAIVAMTSPLDYCLLQCMAAICFNQGGEAMKKAAREFFRKESNDGK